MYAGAALLSGQAHGPRSTVCALWFFYTWLGKEKVERGIRTGPEVKSNCLWWLLSDQVFEAIIRRDVDPCAGAEVRLAQPFLLVG